MKKQKLCIDFDGTLVNTRKSSCECYNAYFNGCDNFVKANWKENSEWDFSDVCKLASSSWLDTMFSSRMFFSKLELFDNVEYMLKELSLQYEIFIVTVGTLMNISRKAEYIHKNLPYIQNVILITDTNGIDKSIVDMSGGIFIDDNLSNLICSNAEKKYVYGETLNYNKNSQFGRLTDWMEVGVELIG